MRSYFELVTINIVVYAYLNLKKIPTSYLPLSLTSKYLFAKRQAPNILIYTADFADLFACCTR